MIIIVPTKSIAHDIYARKTKTSTHYSLSQDRPTAKYLMSN